MKPRILHLSSLYPPHIVGGAERSVSMLAEAQAAEGWNVAAACLTPSEAVEEERHGVTVFRMPHGNDFWLEDWAAHSQRQREWAKFKQQANFAIERRFGEVLDRFRPNVVHTHSMVDISTRVWHAARARGFRSSTRCATSTCCAPPVPCTGRRDLVWDGI